MSYLFKWLVINPSLFIFALIYTPLNFIDLSIARVCGYPPRVPQHVIDYAYKVQRIDWFPHWLYPSLHWCVYYDYHLIHKDMREFERCECFNPDFELNKTQEIKS